MRLNSPFTYGVLDVSIASLLSPDTCAPVWMRCDWTSLQPFPAPTSEQALLYLYRVDAPFGAAVPMKVEINDNEAGILAENSSTSAYVAQGPLKLAATRWLYFQYPESKRVSISGNVYGGKAYYFKIYQTRTGQLIVTHLENVPAETARVELSKLNRSEAPK